MIRELGEEYTTLLRKTYEGRVPGGADLVCYWFDKARAQMAAGQLERAGLVTTNSIRGGANRRVLDAICGQTRIFEAWSDEPWVNDGAAVRVSLVAFGQAEQSARLDEADAATIHADLTSTNVDSAGTESASLTSAKALPANGGTAYVGIQKTGPFEIPGDLAREWLRMPNPNGQPNSAVVRPWFNGLDVTRRNRDMWIVDFGADMQAGEASVFEKPFEHVTLHVKPTRVGKREARTNECYWLFQWSRPVMRSAIQGLPRFIVTPEVAKHRIFALLPMTTVADKNLTVVARADDDTDAGNFKDQKRSNDTHESTTDADARLYRKGKTASELRFMGHTLTDNRHGLVVSAVVTQADGYAEREAAKAMINDARQALPGDDPITITLGADKGYDAKEFIEALQEMNVLPHVAQNKSGRQSAVPDAIADSEGYAISQQKRKLIEQGFGWAKTVGHMRQVLVRGIKKVDQMFVLTMAGYNLTRLRSLGQIRLQGRV